MKPYREPPEDELVASWWVIVEPSMFRQEENLIVGEYRWLWMAKLMAWLTLRRFPYGEARIFRLWGNRE